ncbi:16S rRNA (cytosine(967)-C(5))-methyltransferase RsmB [uncultured Ruminococcus sp.]|uniref:16S rRNA (cytosine(967)-C(5))-methyltransferase RsmB n=1 Tax=uncultured Ruminococcus sp. TaxID=165186 RepID=UPI0025FC0208|nr:16S rRNA (cytosine(967)-C(5))-methyltransferase RsmB [uncultured Ruminococcus sp.]
MGNSRKFVVKLLTSIDDNSSYSNILLDEALKRSSLTPQDKKFATALFYGVLERRYTLDEIIKSLSQNPKNLINHTVRNILRTGLYQLKYMDSVPDSAAVDEAVKLAKKNRNPAIPGFVNAMLRAFIRNDKKLPQGNNDIENLAIEYSCPVWLVEKWDSEYGRQMTINMLSSSLGRAPTVVKVNTLTDDFNDTLDVLLADGATFERNSMVKNSLNVCFAGGAEETTAYKEGRFHVQDLSSQLCCAALDPQEGDTVLDLCSAPGGKTFTIAELMNNKGKVMAFDLHANRVRLIKSGAERLGLDIVEASVNNAKEFNNDLPMADRVLCDVPCSGLGVIRRKPEIKYKDPAEFERLPDIQYKILDTSSTYVKVGGTLVYSTCTLSRAENDNVADKFLEEHSEFEPAPLGSVFSVNSDKCRISITPAEYNSDGFFIAKFVRRR